MSRALRIEFPGALYHAMARGVARMPVFLDDDDRLLLLREIEAQVGLGVLVVHALCLMLNHIHLLCETPLAGMSRIMHDVLGNHASAFNRRHNRVGHLWQGRYKAILVQDGDYLLRCSKYIHLNPLEAGVDNSDFCYPWSSCPNYLGRTSTVPWVCTDRILNHSGGAVPYSRFLKAGKGDCEDPFQLATAGIAFGDRRFVRQIFRHAQQTGAMDDVPAFRLLCQAATVTPRIEAVRSAVRAAFPDSSPCKTRRYLTWALHSYTWLKGIEIARAVGLKRSAISEILRSVERNRISDNDTARRLAAVAEQLGRFRGSATLPARKISLTLFES